MIAKQARRKYLWHPLNWPSWLLALCLSPIARLPYRVQQSLGRLLGRLCYRLMPRRRHIAHTNLKLCFPEWTSSELEACLEHSFIELGIALIETNLIWWRSVDDPIFQQPVEITGAEAIRKAHELGHGVLIIGAHFTTLDLAGCLLARALPITVTMRRLKDPVFDWLLKRARKRHYKGMLDRTEIKSMLRTLKEGEILWYAPDQDYGLDNSIFVPFFGQPAATLRITPKLVDRTHAKVFFGSHYRRNGRIDIELTPLTEPFPTEDLHADVTLINQYLERFIRQCPEQYLWIHRRFKTTEHGEKSILYKPPFTVSDTEKVI